MCRGVRWSAHRWRGALRPLRHVRLGQQVCPGREDRSSLTEYAVCLRKDGLQHYSPTPLRRTSERNSLRGCICVVKTPRMAEVTVAECCFSTPRIIMHKCCASIMTPTP